MQWARSLAFEALFYLGMAGFGLAYLPYALATPRGRAATRAFCGYALWLLRVLCGVRVVIRGAIPSGAVLVAAKHQSFLDVLILNRFLPEPMFVLRRSLLRLPIFGWYVRRMGATAIDRHGGAAAARALAADGAGALSEGGQYVVYPQGTRLAPGAVAPYRTGVAAVYKRAGRACVPVAVNAGMAWRRRRICKRPGVVVAQFLPLIPPDLPPRRFLTLLEARIEAASAQLWLEGPRGGG